jgi:Ig domain of plant-specific actin-binding protein
MYAPEPFDVGKILQAEIILSSEKAAVTTTGPINPGMISYYEKKLYKIRISYETLGCHHLAPKFQKYPPMSSIFRERE